MANTLIEILREYIPKRKQIHIDVSHSMNKKYTCANPSGPVSNEFCPEEDPLCNCPCKEIIPRSTMAVTAQWLLDNKWEFSLSDFDFIYYNDPEEHPWAVIKGVYEDKGISAENQDGAGNNPIYELFPGGWESFHGSKTAAVDALEIAYGETGGYTMDEPSDSYLNSLLKSSSECDAIESKLGPSWLGCDWEDPNSPMSCNCPCIGENYTKYLRYNTSIATFWDTPGYVPLIANAHKQSLQSQKIGISIPGDLSIRPGDVIFLDLLDVPHGFDEIDKIARKYGIITPIEKNSKYHGKWMVSSIRHRLYGVSYHKMDLILIRDGLPAYGFDQIEESPESTSSSSSSGFVPIVPGGYGIQTPTTNTTSSQSSTSSTLGLPQDDTDYGY